MMDAVNYLKADDFDKLIWQNIPAGEQVILLYKDSYTGIKPKGPWFPGIDAKSGEFTAGGIKCSTLKWEIVCSREIYEKFLHELSNLAGFDEYQAYLLAAKTRLQPNIVEGTQDTKSNKPKGNPKYDVTIHGKYGTGTCIVDAYRILEACKVTNPQLAHAGKKVLFSGKRGHKDLREDLVDIRDSAQSALDMHDDIHGKFALTNEMMGLYNEK